MNTKKGGSVKSQGTGCLTEASAFIVVEIEMKRLTGQKHIQRSPKSSMLEKRLPESSVCVVTTDYLGPPSDCRQCFPFFFFFSFFCC